MEIQSIFIFLKFSVSGLIGVLINFSLTFILKENLKINKYFSSSFSLLIALIINYILNRYWTFQVIIEPIHIQFLKFFMVVLISIFFNHFIVFSFHRFLRINFYYSKLIAVILVFIWNFTMHSVYTFNSF